MAYLDDTGLAYFWGKIKAWANSVFALLGHTHPSSDVTLMTGYSKPSASSAIAASDTLNQAVGKLEKGVETADGNAVHLTGAETVSGLKTLLVAGGNHLVFRIPGYTRGDALSGDKAVTVPFCDEQGEPWNRQGTHGRIGCLECRAAADGSSLTYLSVCRNAAGATGFANLAVGYDSGGTAYAKAPSTSSSRSAATDVVTRDWVAPGGGGGVMHVSGDETVSGNKIFTRSFQNSTTTVDRNTTVSAENSAIALYLKNGNSNNYLLELKYGRFPSGISSSIFRCWSGNGYWFDLRLQAGDNDRCWIECFKHSSLGFEGSFIPIRAKVGNNAYSDIVQTWQSDNNNYRNCTIRCTNGSGYNELTLGVHNESNSDPGGITIRSTNGPLYATVSGNFYPTANGSYSLGINSNRWSNVYAITTNIGSSDRRIKEDIAPIPDAVLDAWDGAEWIQYRFRDAVAEKGSSARLHSGLVAQDIGEAFAAAGLDASAYGFFCYDRWDGKPEERTDGGELLHAAEPAGDLYSLRYAEALCMEAAYMRRENARLKKRVADLEERLAALELKVS